MKDKANGKNIAIIINGLSGGGAEKVACILSKILSQNNNVYLFVEQCDKNKSYEYEGNICYTEIGTSEKSKKLQFIKIVRNSLKLRKLKKKYHIDISISFMEHANVINILSKGRDKVILRVCTILSAGVEEYQNLLVYNKWILRNLYNLADKIVVMTRYAKHDLVDHYGIKHNKITIIENSLDVDDIDNKKNEKVNWEYGDNAIISVNRLHTVKRQWILIKAFSKVVETIPNATLVFVGEGQLRNRLEVLSKRLGVSDKVFFVGQKKNVFPYLKKSKCFVLTSKREGYSNSMIEALYMGLPVVALDCPGSPKEILLGKYNTKKINRIIWGKYGILVPDTDNKNDDVLDKHEMMLAEAIEKVLINNNVYNRYYECAKENIKKYDSKAIGEKWKKVIFN